MESTIKKDIILNGTESIAVFKENGLVYRTKDIDSYTPIVFRNLKANVRQRFELKDVLTKPYIIKDAVSDFLDDDDLINVSEQEGNNVAYRSAYFSVSREGKRIFSRSFQLSGGFFFYYFLALTPQDSVDITSDVDLNSLTFYCSPAYLENQIVVPEIPTNGLEPQSEPQASTLSDNRKSGL